MSSIGTVASWDVEEGWGVIESAETPGGCWFHFSAWLGRGTNPELGTLVAFDAEAGRQDGYDFRALEVWPQGSEPLRREPDERGAGYTSFGWITFTGPSGEQVSEQL